MEKSKIFDYYAFGHDYRLLLEDRKMDTNERLADRYSQYLDFVVKLNLHITKSAIQLKKLDDEIEKLVKLGAAVKTKDLTVEEALHNSLQEKILMIDTTLDAELNTKTGYILDEKRFSNEILIDNISRLFNNGYFLLMPSIAQYDFRESGICLAFDRFTACAFHALRATEDILKWYYSLVLSATPTDTDTWGTYETAIKNGITNRSINPAPSEHLIINIGSIRKYYRNKTQHPQLMYSLDDAQDLLSLCTKTTSELISDLKSRNLI
jgi:hypothetical protein